MLSLEDVSLFVNGKLLLNDANLRVNRGDRKGIIGRNGSGKSHLLELMAGNINPDGGKRKLTEAATVLLVKQELPDENQTPLEFMRNNDPDILDIEASLDNLPDDELSNAYSRLGELDEKYEQLAPKVLKGLGLTEEQINQPMRNLSGGLRMRISLSMALVRTPDVLLLDEPTNHLDLESTQWLIQYLRNYPKNSAFVIVTHDIALLTAVTNSIVHLRAGTLTEFGGDYYSYKEELAIREEKDKQKNADLDKQIKQKMDIYYRFRDLPENRAAQAVSQKKNAEKLMEKKVELVIEEPIVTFAFAEPAELPDPILELKNVAIGYNNKPILENLNLSLQSGAKIGLLGRNGEGKTSLIKLLVGKLSPLSGRMDTSPRLKIGYFSQELTDELDTSLTVYQQFQAVTDIKNDAETRQNLGRFGFSWDKVNTLVGNLSGGEKSRLLFSLICFRSPNLIILDEPTNHLDVETREVLVTAIKDFKGTVLLVSHDWDLHAKTMEKFWLAQGGAVKPLTKGLEHYQQVLLKFIEKNLQSNENSIIDAFEKLTIAENDNNNANKSNNSNRAVKGSSGKKSTNGKSDSTNQKSPTTTAPQAAHFSKQNKSATGVVKEQSKPSVSSNVGTKLHK